MAFFAWSTWAAERARKRQRRIEVESRISTTAFQLRRQLKSWLTPARNPISPIRFWLLQHQGDYGVHLDRAEHRLEEMTTLAGEASETVATRVEMAFVLFLGGTRRLTEFAAAERPSGEAGFAHDRLIVDAAQDFEECIKALEAGVIAQSLLIADHELDEIHDSNDAFRVLAAAIEKRGKWGK